MRTAAVLCLLFAGQPATAARVGEALDERKVGAAARFIPIKPGSFDMGSPGTESEDRYRDERLHRVTLTKAFELQSTPVTQLQYLLVMGENPSRFKRDEDCDRGGCGAHPVENVSWHDAHRFIAKLNETQAACAYRLPTEAEREYAARSGKPSSFPYSFGSSYSSELDEYVWYHSNSGSRTHAVASKRANPWGLYDMHGNVWEWTQDWYADYPATAETDPAGPAAGSLRVVRGGSWASFIAYLRSAHRNGSDPGGRWDSVGFRLARSCRRTKS